VQQNGAKKCAATKVADYFCRMDVQKIHTCTGHRAAVYALAPGRDERHFFSAGGDGWVTEWNLDEPDLGKLAAAVETQIFSLCRLTDNRLVAGNMNGGVHWIDREYPDKTLNVQHHKKGVYDIIAARNWVFTVGGDGVLTRWDAEKGRTVESFQLSNQALRAISFSEKRRELAVGASDNSIYLLDAETFELNTTLKNAHKNSVFTVAYSPDSQFLLSGGRDAMLHVWDLENPQSAIRNPQSPSQPAHLFTINHIVFSPDGKLFATASRDKTLKIWDVRTFQLQKVVDTIRHGGHINSVNRLLWLPDCLVSCGDDRTVMLWHVKA
jgi:WD40 repeat protein